MVMMNLAVHRNHVQRHLHVMIVYVCLRINRDVIHGRNDVMVMHFVQIDLMNAFVRIGGVIPTMEHFYAKISIVSTKLGSVMVRRRENEYLSFESILCIEFTGTDDCGDHSDEVNCPSRVPRRIVTAAVIGATI